MRRYILSILILTISALAQTPTDTTLPSPTRVSNIIDQISLTTPAASPTPIEALPTTDQPIPQASNQESTPTPTTQTSTQIINIITAPQSLLPTSATSLVPDTREFSALTLDVSEVETTSRGQTKPPSPGSSSSSTSVVSATTINNTAPKDVQNSANGVAVGGKIAVSAFALVVAVGGLTWVFAEF